MTKDDTHVPAKTGSEQVAVCSRESQLCHSLDLVAINRILAVIVAPGRADCYLHKAYINSNILFFCYSYLNSIVHLLHFVIPAVCLLLSLVVPHLVSFADLSRILQTTYFPSKFKTKSKSRGFGVLGFWGFGGVG